MWQLTQTEQFERDTRWYRKKRPDELAAVLRNLDRYVAMLNVAPNSKAVQAGFLHGEQAGVVAVDQKGGGGQLQETRLYTYPDDQAKILHLITIGNKDQQSDDVQFSKEFAMQLRGEKG